MAPMLNGTEREVVWAEEIRTAFLKAVDELPVKAAQRPIYQKRAMRLVEKYTEAGWWIENRNMDARRVLRTVAERTGKVLFGTDTWTPEAIQF